MDILLLFVGLIGLFINFGNRIKRLESKVELLSRTTQGSSEQPQTDPARGERMENYLQAPAPADATPMVSAQPSVPSVSVEPKFITWFKEDWLIKVGALLLFIGFTWFVSYAFANNWIGPMGRIALGLLVGAGVMVFGFVRMQKFVRQGSIFLALGTAVVVLTTYAGRSEYGFFTSGSALALMFIAVLFAAVASLRYRSEWLAWMSAIAAYVIPLMTVPKEVHELEFFTYLFLVTIGVLWLVFKTDWRRIFIVTLFGITAYSFPYWVSGFVSEGGVLIYGYVFVAMFFLANLAGFLSLSKGRSPEVEVVGAIWNAIIFTGWTHAGIGPEWQSLVYSIWAVVFLVGAYFFSQRMRMQIPFFVYAGIGVIFIGIATALELDGPALTIAFLLESTVAILLSLLATTEKKFQNIAALTFLVPFGLSVESFSRFPVFPDSVFTQHVAVVLLTMVAMFVVGMTSMSLARKRGTMLSEGVGMSELFLTVSGLYLYLFMWLFLRAILPSDTATQFALFISMITGVYLYVKFQPQDGNSSRGMHLVGLMLVLFVIGHLLLIEVWQMDIVPRIITFFVLGAFLMSTAFIKKMKKQ